MRKALVSLIAAGAAVAVSASAFAQDATSVAEPTVPATIAVPATPAPEVAPPAVEPSVPAVTPPVATPEVVAPPVVEAPPAPPPAPTDPTTLRVLNILETLCQPLVQGGDIAQLTKAQGFRKKRDVYVMTLAKPGQITIIPSATNKNVCSLEIMHAPGGDQALTVGLHNWAMARGYNLYRNDEFTTDLKRHTRSWELTADGKTSALVLVTEWKPDGSPVARNADRSTIMYSVP